MRNYLKYGFLTVLILVSMIFSFEGARAEQEDGRVRHVKVMIITLFDQTPDPSLPGEATLWKQNDNLNKQIGVKGLSKNYPSVFCNDNEECVMTTDIGYANASASITALLFSRKFDLRDTYFIISGIAGIDPSCGTLGSVVWVRTAVDGGIVDELDAREMPAGWTTGYFGQNTAGPGVRPPSVLQTQVYQLDPHLRQRGMDLAKKVKLLDNPDAQAYRAHYPNPPANQPPTQVEADSLSYDVYWYGNLMSQRAINWVNVMTFGSGKYCVTDEEDNAVLTGLTRGAEAGLLDFSRVALMRSGAGFDAPYPGRSAFDGLVNDLQGGIGGYVPSVTNLYNVGEPLVKEILKHWDDWKKGTN